MPTRTLRRDVVSTLAAASIALVSRASFADHYRVPTGSMEPTVEVGDQICVNKAAYGIRLPASNSYLARTAQPARGDVVVLSSPVDGEVLLKRVVAVPGDVVEVRNGRVTIDGKPVPVHREHGALVEELGAAHELGTDYGGGPDFGPVQVPALGYLVLGDNRGNSNDGRFFGWVTSDAILGRAVSVCIRHHELGWHSL
jgi:signal peptidase I